MVSGPNIARVGALIGDPARAMMLQVLLDGRALTATDLALEGGVTPQTASAHLAKLVDGGLLSVRRDGRHRYFRIADAEIARMLETVQVVANITGPPRPRRIPRPIQLARTCYDHFAGQLGVALSESMVAQGSLRMGDDSYELTDAGTERLGAFGIDTDAVRGRKRAFARRCLDWSERRPHLAGALGAAITDRCFALGWVARPDVGRGILLTPLGARGFRREFGIGTDELPRDDDFPRGTGHVA